MGSCLRTRPIASKQGMCTLKHDDIMMQCRVRDSAYVMSHWLIWSVAAMTASKTNMVTHSMMGMSTALNYYYMPASGCIAWLFNARRINQISGTQNMTRPAASSQCVKIIYMHFKIWKRQPQLSLCVQLFFEKSGHTSSCTAKRSISPDGPSFCDGLGSTLPGGLAPSLLALLLLLLLAVSTDSDSQLLTSGWASAMPADNRKSLTLFSNTSSQ